MTNPIMVQISARRYMIISHTGSSGCHQKFIGGKATGEFYKRSLGEVRFTGNYADCITWIENNTDPVTTPGDTNENEAQKEEKQT